MKAQLFTTLVIFAACAVAAQSDRAGLKPGTLAEPWLTGGPNCLTVPDWQVHEYNEDFYILRESGCVDFEKPFLYLIFGEKKALLEDTGVASAEDKSVIPTAPVIMDLMAKWAERKNHAPVSLVVIHSHSHGDHTAADAQFKEMPGVQFIAADAAGDSEGGRNRDVAHRSRPDRFGEPHHRCHPLPGS